MSAQPVAAVRERPILFSAPMILALLAGRKTQTRRGLSVRKIKPSHWGHESIGAARLRDGLWQFQAGSYNVWSEQLACPYGVPGHRLWVRETWEDSGFKRPFTISRGGPELPPVLYSADLPADWKGHTEYRRRPSIFMPRWASRITLEITEVRVQRLREITEQDAIAEGINRKRSPWAGNPWVWCISFVRRES